MVGRIIEGTITLIVVYLVLTKASEFSRAADAVGSNYSKAVQTLQGR